MADASPPPDVAPLVLAERVGDVLWLTLNRPAQLNAVSMAMRDELWAQLCLLRDDPTIRVAVIHGAGERALSAGADITEFGTAPSYIDARRARQERDVWGVMAALPVPIIAAMQGFAFGAGLEMSLYCDLRVASEDATFALPEVKLGYIPSAGGSQLAAKYLPSGDAVRLVASGEPIDAAEAYRLGLVHAVAPKAELLATAREWAEAIASAPAAAMRATKRAVVEGLDLPLGEGVVLERRLAARAAAER